MTKSLMFRFGIWMLAVRDIMSFRNRFLLLDHPAKWPLFNGHRPCGHPGVFSCEDLTSSFYSGSADNHACTNPSGDRLVLPLCTASCNTNTLVAVGDQEGGIRLLDSAKDDKSGFSKAYLSFHPHMNAIMDLEFSSDDMLLATASGDQTALVIDMATQKPIYCLSNHVSSLKRVQFQPSANNKVLTTCSRDGNVNIWDLRCKGFEKPCLQVRCSLDSESEQTAAPQTSKMIYPQVLNTIHGAHAWMPQTSAAEKAEHQIGRSDITVTSLAFLPQGRENLFVTASEANACVRLWDLRTAHSNRRGRPVLPVSTTREPESHVKYRRFGVTSLTLGGDGSRLYTLCRDGTVYAYSTSHLKCWLSGAAAIALCSSPRTSGISRRLSNNRLSIWTMKVIDRRSIRTALACVGQILD
ncbi:conserved hypothetical protein [Aspergillus terreus NIH2624]|uniref:Uncharacterized protein n=1 Tax=Aspergillus terreus (strain NIH 2624 / FGSC A1156) TaxID=341663 RepID=Q0CVE3_ASPTN|nr:uncharacterized protein ATEG_02341 [Aspergillus terreus NIH2624]EAU37303.1 conserved hypothetical protein [Aspergillus terreus NIH2624]